MIREIKRTTVKNSKHLQKIGSEMACHRQKTIVQKYFTNQEEVIITFVEGD
jgi:hypothetical protein